MERERWRERDGEREMERERWRERDGEKKRQKEKETDGLRGSKMRYKEGAQRH